MPINKLTIKIEGDEKVLSNFSKVQTDLMNPRWFLNEYALIYMPSIQEQFASGGREFGTPWPYLKPITIIKKVKEGFPPIPLVRTGTMKNNFRYQVRTSSLAQKTPGYLPTGLLTIYNPTSYFKFHQSGVPKKIPQRVMLRFDEVRKRLSFSLFVGWIKNIVYKHFKV